MPNSSAKDLANTKEKLNEHQHIEQLYRQYSGQVLASLTRRLNDISLAEEAMHEAFTLALELWPKQGVPNVPSAWLITTGSHKAIDLLRRKQTLSKLSPTLQQLANEVQEHNAQWQTYDIEDDQLRLIFTCCHPAIAPPVQIALTLREVCGLSTEEIASAFFTTEATMAQRIVRGKKKIRQAGIPFVLPAENQRQERLEAVLKVIYLVYNEGYSASTGGHALRLELCAEAIRLGRLLNQLMRDVEIQGLLALMLLQESRREARVDSNGDIVLLEDQDRSLWNRSLITEGEALVSHVLRSKHLGFYTLQAAIAAVHANAKSAAETDWPQIVALYQLLYRISPSPVVALNQAVAQAMRDGPEAGLAALEALAGNPQLKHYHLYHASRAELLSRAGDKCQAEKAFEKALQLCQQEPERRLLQKKLNSLLSK